MATAIFLVFLLFTTFISSAVSTPVTEQSSGPPSSTASALRRNIAELGNLKQLQGLSLHSNNFHGSIPGSLSSLPLLRALYLHNNTLSGDVPPGILEMKNIQVVISPVTTCRAESPAEFLIVSEFSGEIPASIGGLQWLQYLWLVSNLLVGTLLRRSSAVPRLFISRQRTISSPAMFRRRLEQCRCWRCSRNRIVGEFPSWVADIPTLRILDLSGNLFTGSLIANFGNLTRLEELRVANNSLTGQIPGQLGQCRVLRVLDLEGNQFSGKFLGFFENLNKLRVLSLGRNRFVGSIDIDVGSIQSLEVLNLSENELTGVVQDEVLQLTGNIPNSLSRLSQLKVLNLGHNNLNGSIQDEIFNSSNLQYLALDSNHLSGSIPSSLSNLLHLRTLDLSSNNLSGSIPENITHIPTLLYLNLSSNHLEGEIPKTLGTHFNDPSLFANNSNLCGSPLKNACPSVGKKKRSILLIAVALAGVLVLTLCCCGYVISLLRWRKKLKEKATWGEKKPSTPRRSSKSRSSSESGVPKLVMFNNKITLPEALEATRQFDEENVLSRGKYGMVFKASFNDGMVLAIRRLPDGLLENRVFKKEAEMLGKVKHRNLTVLRGYYAGPPDIRLLVYDYMPNGNLATLLQEASHHDGHVLNWPMRHLIALGIARGITFLHTSEMVHGDIKPQNVLFDADFEAHLSEFGLDRLTFATPIEASTSTPSIGTLGYVAPEDEDIVKWVKKQLQKGQISELLALGYLELDPESSEWEEFLLGIKIGLLCTAVDPSDRPLMGDIVFMLEGCRVGPDIPSSADPTRLPSPAG
uniref:Protein kinase domain-containing protein n=1 Tax=Chenopodium quinoa TaxID=63459 RepID=A0A803NCU9_CHEQI